jgi:hypothetical protein
VGGTVSQCNDVGNDPTMGTSTVTCTITVTNDFVYNPADPSNPIGLATIVTSVQCSGGALCVDTSGSQQSPTPITVINQCNNIANVGASTVTCTVTVTNNLTGYPDGTPVAPGILQCQDVGVDDPTCVGTPTGNDQTGTGGPGGQGINQCNSSGGPGGTVSCTFTVDPPSQSTGLPTTITQCNGSGTGGGSTVTCTSTLTNNFPAATTGDTTTTGVTTDGTTAGTTTDGTTAGTTGGTTAGTTGGTTAGTTAGTTGGTTAGTTGGDTTAGTTGGTTGDTTAGTKVVTTMPNGEVKVDVLPDTGGPMLLPVAAILLLASSGLLMLIARRRQHG